MREVSQPTPIDGQPSDDVAHGTLYWRQDKNHPPSDHESRALTALHAPPLTLADDPVRGHCVNQHPPAHSSMPQYTPHSNSHTCRLTQALMYSPKARGAEAFSAWIARTKRSLVSGQNAALGRLWTLGWCVRGNRAHVGWRVCFCVKREATILVNPPPFEASELKRRCTHADMARWGVLRPVSVVSSDVFSWPPPPTILPDNSKPNVNRAPVDTYGSCIVQTL